MNTLTIWVINNRTGKKLYVAIIRHIESATLQVAISYDEALLKTKFPDRIYDSITSLTALGIESPESRILFTHGLTSDDAFKVERSIQDGINVIDVWEKDKAPKKMMN